MVLNILLIKSPDDSVIGNVYLTLLALKSPKTLLGRKIIVSLLKILSWKPSFSKKSDWLTWVFTLLLSHNNSLAWRYECYSVDNYSLELLLWYPLLKEITPIPCYTSKISIRYSKSVLFRMYFMWYERVFRWYKNGWYDKTLVRKTHYSVI